MEIIITGGSYFEIYHISRKKSFPVGLARKLLAIASYVVPLQNFIEIFIWH